MDSLPLFVYHLLYTVMQFKVLVLPYFKMSIELNILVLMWVLKCVQMLFCC